MTKIERVDASLAGKPFDRPPVSFWYHFGVQHAPGERIAELSLEFLRSYDLDYLKLMNDYFPPMPEGTEEITDAEGLRRIARFDVEKSDWAQQLRAIDILARELDGEAYFIDTVFEPYQVLLRSYVGENLDRLIEEEPDAVLGALDVVTENVIDYCTAALKRGAAGIFLSTFSASKQMSRDRYMRFAYPFVERIFKAVQDLGIMNTAHLHDYGIFVDDMVKLPIDIISYEDTDSSNPDMPTLRTRWSGSIMGGMDKHRITRVTPAEARRNAEAGIAAGGPTKFFLAPGCSFPTWFFPQAGHAIVDAAKRAAR